MSDNEQHQNDEQEEVMQSFTFRLKPSMLEAAREKAGLIDLSKIFRRLVEMWINGDIKISGVDE